jgi:hypothetical protein
MVPEKPKRMGCFTMMVIYVVLFWLTVGTWKSGGWNAVFWLWGTCGAVWAIAAYRRNLEAERSKARALAAVKAAADEARARDEAERAARWQRLRTQYGEAVALKILEGRIWVGCPAAICREIHGQPADIDEKVMKTKVKHTYKYRPMGGNRYGFRVFVEDGTVVGWEDKDD